MDDDVLLKLECSDVKEEPLDESYATHDIIEAVDGEYIFNEHSYSRQTEWKTMGCKPGASLEAQSSAGETGHDSSDTEFKLNLTNTSGLKSELETNNADGNESDLCSSQLEHEGRIITGVKEDRKEHTCAMYVCMKSLHDSSGLKPHMMAYEKPYTCTFCSRSFRCNDMFREHMITHATNKRRYICTICSESFSRNDNLTRHLLIHTKEKAYICTICSKSFRYSSDLKSHMLIHTMDTPYRCIVCNHAFPYSSILKTHMMIHTSERLYTCTACSKSFSKRTRLQIHMITHTSERPYICPICKRMFTLRDNMINHMLMHIEMKPQIICIVCNKSFSCRSDLNAHVETHGNEAFNSSVCCELFEDIAQHEEHKKFHRNPSEDSGDKKLYNCSLCKNSYDDRSHLIEHMGSHTNQTPLNCCLCSESFTHESSLTLHVMEIHSNENP